MNIIDHENQLTVVPVCKYNNHPDCPTPHGSSSTKMADGWSDFTPSMPKKKVFETRLGTAVLKGSNQAIELVGEHDKHEGLERADAFQAAKALSAGANGAWVVLHGVADKFSIAPALTPGRWHYAPDRSASGELPGHWYWHNESLHVTDASVISRLYSDNGLAALIDGDVELYPVRVGA